jgi:hypothetical protein
MNGDRAPETDRAPGVHGKWSREIERALLTNPQSPGTAFLIDTVAIRNRLIPLKTNNGDQL